MAVPLVMFAVQAGAAYMQKRATDAGLVSQGRANVINTALADNATTQQMVDAGQVAAEQKSDRMREAQRQLSMAQLMAAEGAGQFDAKAFAIRAVQADDMGRLDANYARQSTAFLNQKEGIRRQGEATASGLRHQAKAARNQFAVQVAQAAVSSYLGSLSKASDVAAAKGLSVNLDTSLTSGAPYRLPNLTP